MYVQLLFWNFKCLLMFLWHVGLHTIKMNGRWWKMSAGGVATCRITLSPTPNTGPLQESHIPLGSLDIGSRSYWYIVTRHSSFNLCGWLRAFCDHNNMCSRLPSVCSCFSGSCISAGGKPSNWLPSTFNFSRWLEGEGIHSMWTHPLGNTPELLNIRWQPLQYVMGHVQLFQLL